MKYKPQCIYFIKIDEKFNTIPNNNTCSNYLISILTENVLLCPICPNNI